MKLNTYLITRFNIPMGFKGKDNEVVVPDDNWMEHRMDLFLKYCEPSVRKQSFKNFVWFIIVHEDTDKKYLDKICENENVVLLKGRTFPEVYQAFSKDFLSPNEAYFTMRLDNDDSIHPKFIESLYSAGKAFLENTDVMGNPFAINFRTGLDYDLHKKNFYLRDYPASSFVSVFSSPSADSQHKTVLDYHHAHIHKNINVVNVKTKEPMWMINIHDMNVGNEVKGEIVSQDFDLVRFGKTVSV